MEQRATIDPKLFWKALSNRTCSAALVTAATNDEPAGFLALSVTHLTASPPTLMLSVSKSTSALATMLASRALAVNYLDASDRDLTDVFTGKTGRYGKDRFDPERWGTLATGSPVLHTALGALDCVVSEVIERFDTMIVLAQIVDFRNAADGEALIHFQGAFSPS